MLYWLILATLFNLSLAPTPVLAVCPVCTVAVGAGLGLSRFLGIDDTISGVWVGGLIISSSLWFNNWLEKKYGFGIKFLPPTIITFFLALTIIPLWWMGIIGHPFNTVFGVDKLIVGILAGLSVFLAAVRADRLVRQIRGQQLFVYQKVIFPVLALVIISLVFQFLVKR